MHTIYTYTSVKEVTGYFIEMKTPETYYSDNQEFTGFWVGKAASRLGLDGRVDAKSFERLCENRHPETGEPLTPITRDGRRLGQDHVFGVPKSVSLAYAYTGDERFIQAMRSAGQDAIRTMETMMATRVRKDGQDFDRPTGNLVGSEHVHLTTRPVDGFPDPHLHVHYVIFNMTYDPVEKKFKAAQMGDVVENTVFLDKVFLTSLAERLKKLGLEITPTEQAFEISGFPRELIERYSRRTKEIEETAARLGITDPVQKAKLGALTRERKAKSLLMGELKEFWLAGLSEQDKVPLKAVETLLRRSRAMEEAAKMQFEPDGAKIEKTSRALGQENQVKDTGRKRRGSVNRRTAPEEMTEETTVRVTDHDRRAVAFAMKHIYERQSAATLNQLQTEAFNGWSCGRATWRGVAQVLAETPLLRGQFKGRELVTTAEVLAEENRLVDGCLEGKWRHEAVNPNWKIHDEKLNEQQREAVKHVLTSRDWVIGIAGKAGTGKTTLLHEVRRGVEAGSKKFLPLAPSSEAARETLRGEGFKNAETVAQLLVSEKLQRESRGAVWIVDEAGLLSSRQADRLFSLAKELDARLVLVGDTGQHHSVERGQAFDLLENFAHLSVTHVEEIMRQKGFLKQVVKRVAEGNVEEAIGMLKESGDIQQMTLEERKIALAADYVGAIERGKTALVVAPTHAECNDVTAGIRELLKEKKMIKQGAQWDILRNLSWTEAAREDYDHYEKGQVVQFNGHVKGFALGERAEVVGVKDGAVMVRSESGDAGKIKKLPLRESKKFNVYERDKAEICAGELVRIRINSRTADGHRVSNGNLYKVDHIDGKGQLVLENGWKLDKDFAHLDYGYTLTSHAAQSKTVDSVFVAQTAKLSTCASDLNQFYVSISRGRSELKIYTDDIDLLMEIVSQVRERPMATEILHGNAEEEKRLAEIFGVEQAELAAFLGQVDATELKREMEIELEKIRQRQQEMSKTREMEMTMGM